MLTLYNAGLTDNSIQSMATGIQKVHTLVYLDLRQNTFESVGFKKLIEALIGNPALLTLRLNAIKIEAEEIEVLK